MQPNGTAGQPTDRPIRSVGVIFAMEAEGASVADTIGLGPPEPLHENLPMRIRRGRLDDLEVTMAFNGIDSDHQVDRIGTEAATLTTWMLLQQQRIDLLVNAGTCGGFQAREGHVGKVYMAGDGLYFHDHRVNIDGFREYAEGPIMLSHGSVLAGELGLDSGPVSTGCSLDVTPAEIRFFQERGVIAKDMEAAAIARVARDMGIPCIAVKSVTDIVDSDKPTHEEFLRNLARAVDRLDEVVISLLRLLAEGRTLDRI